MEAYDFPWKERSTGHLFAVRWTWADLDPQHQADINSLEGAPTILYEISIAGLGSTKLDLAAESFPPKRKRELCRQVSVGQLGQSSPVLSLMRTQKQ